MIIHQQSKFGRKGLRIFAAFLCLCLFGISPAIGQIKLGLGNLGTETKSEEGLKIDFANPKDYTLEDIRVVGGGGLNTSAVISISGLIKGEKIKIPGENISGAIKNIWRKGLVGDVKINAEAGSSADKVVLIIVLTERARLSRYVFSGIPKGQQQTLSDKISLIRGKVLNDAILKNTERAIVKHYADKGFRNTQVEIRRKKDTLMQAQGGNWEYLDIHVAKNSKIKINQIIFDGVTKVKTSKLARKMKKTKQKRFGRIFQPSKFIGDEFYSDKQNLISFYRDNGYRDAVIEEDSVWENDDKTVNIYLKINEGNQYVYRDISWSGNTIYDDETLNRVLGVERGDVYNRSDLDKRLQFNPAATDVYSLYMDDGYLFFNLRPVEVRTAGDSIDIEMRMFEGEQATINKIILEGNTVTSDHVVLRELRTLPGEKFSRSELIRTRQMLSSLGYFDPETIDIRPEPNQADGTVDLRYALEEKSGNQFELSGGWGGFYGFVGTLGLTINNFSLRKVFSDWRPIPQGDGQKLSLRMQSNGARFQNYTFSFTEPWLGGRKPNSLSVSVNHSINRYIDPFTNIVQGTLKITSLSTSFGRRLSWPDDYFTMINTISYNQYFLDNYQVNFGNFTDGTSTNITLNTTISRSSVNNPTYPRSGSQLTLSASFTPPYSLISPRDNYSDLTPQERFKFVEFHKWMFDNTWYTRIAGDLVLRSSIHLGYIGQYNKKVGISPFERFILGGSGLSFNNFLLGTDIVALRGYADNSIKPVEFVDGKLESEIGGVVYNKYVMELRYPLSLQPAATIFLVSFAEAGNTWGHSEDFNPFEVKRSVGVGARIFMPAFGMLGFDYAYGFDQVAGSSTKVNGGQFHFTIGQQIR